MSAHERETGQEGAGEEPSAPHCGGQGAEGPGHCCARAGEREAESGETKRGLPVGLQVEVQECAAQEAEAASQMVPPRPKRRAGGSAGEAGQASTCAQGAVVGPRALALQGRFRCAGPRMRRDGLEVEAEEHVLGWSGAREPYVRVVQMRDAVADPGQPFRE